MIKSGLIDLKSENKKISEDKEETENPDENLNLVEKICDFNNWNQTANRLNILTPDQMFSRLPITLAQVKAEHNSEKLKNEIRQLLFYFRWKKLTKTIYKHFINII